MYMKNGEDSGSVHTHCMGWGQSYLNKGISLDSEVVLISKMNQSVVYGVSNEMYTRSNRK